MSGGVAGPSDPDGDEEQEAPTLKELEAEVSTDELLKAFYSDLKDTDRDNEVNRIMWAFKLNPFEKLNLRFDATPEDIRRQFRKVSLMVHPDKCKHPQASAAFDLLGAAQKELLNEDTREHLDKVLELAKGEVRKERAKSTKHDNLVKVAALLNEEGRDGVEAAWESSEAFHEAWRLKAREVLATMEWRKRKLGKRLKDEVARIEGDEKTMREQAKLTKKAKKEWEEQREQRVDSWRGYVAGKPGKATGELRPPKQRANDEDKLYVRRPVKEEEFRQAAPPSRKANNAPKPQPPPPL